MIDEIKAIAQGVLDNYAMLHLCQGTVEELEPLTIRLQEVEGKLGTESLMIAGYLKEASCYQNLQRGQKVLMLAPVWGNKYYLMDVMTE